LSCFISSDKTADLKEDLDKGRRDFNL